MDNPYLHLRKVGSNVESNGLASCFLGHKIHRPRGHKPDGVFAEWHWDGTRLHVHNDRYGFYPLYYFTKEDEIAISTSISRLVDLGAPTAFDEAGLAVFLRLGFFIGEDTPFRAIRVVPPNTTFEWKNGELHVSGKYTLGKPQRLSRSDAIDSYYSLFREAMRRRLPPHDDFVVPLSSGRDSRQMLLELCKLGRQPKFCVTVRPYPPRADQDVVIASRLAETLGIKHVVLDQPSSRLKSELKKNVQTSFCADEHTWYLPVAEYLESRTDTIYDGIAGGSLLGRVFLTPLRLKLFETGRFSDLAEEFIAEREVFIARILTTKYYRTFSHDLAVSHLVEEIGKHVEAPNPPGSFFFWNRLRREIALCTCCLIRDIENIFCPYIDYELYDFVTSLPANALMDKQFHDDVIRKVYPRYADIPYGNEYAPQVGDLRYFRQFALELSRYAFLNRSSRIVRSGYLMPRLLRVLVDRKYSESIEWLGPIALYLLQLERLSQ